MNKLQSILVICFGLILATTLEAKSTVTTIPLGSLGLNSITTQTLIDGDDLYIGSTELDDGNICGSSKLYKVNSAGEVRSINISSIVSGACVEKILKNKANGAVVLQTSSAYEGLFGSSASLNSDDSLINLYIDETENIPYSNFGQTFQIDKAFTAKNNKNKWIFYIFDSIYLEKSQLISYNLIPKLLTESSKLIDVAVSKDQRTLIEAYSCGIQAVQYTGTKKKILSYPLAGENFCTHVNNSPLSTEINDMAVIDKYLFYSTYIPEEDSDNYCYVKDLSNNKKQYIGENLYLDSIHIHNDYIYDLNKYNGIFRKKGIFSKSNIKAQQLLETEAGRSLTLLSQSGNKLILLQDASIYSQELSFTNSPGIDVVVYLLQ